MLRDHYTLTIYIFQMMIARPKWILNASVVALSNLNGVYVARSLYPMVNIVIRDEYLPSSFNRLLNYCGNLIF